MSDGIRRDCHCLQGGRTLDKNPKGVTHHLQEAFWFLPTREHAHLQWRELDNLLSIFFCLSLGRSVVSVIHGVDPIILTDVDAVQAWRIDEGGHKIGFQGCDLFGLSSPQLQLTN
ncbi:uncharacterized protein PgNI_08817 [Pyricularia grisea]|uniref:Uncharacterized protein n=1 Tax=Pyricularia grisea TaxID=148305 RepID=A0A6P8AVU6_PYRGI|nr:uncharacterized protein PgNI_08817 [Pyricularia grisea]TLD06315.1 hypothetical protein PgNI_08817 [Pyricularia grisea]